MRGRWTAMLLALGSAGCADDSASQVTTRAESEDRPLVVAAVNYPLAYLAGRIGGAAVEVLFPVPPDVDPAYWQPAAEGVARFGQADLILLNGAGYAGWTRTATLPTSRVVDTSRAFANRLIELEDQLTHTHGPEGEHAHGAAAFTTWLDPRLAIQHAEAVRDALAALRPETIDAFQTAFASLEVELQALDRRLEAAVAQAPDRAVVFSHPVYDYLARRYAIAGTSVHWEPDQAPTPEQWSQLEQVATEHGARWMIWEGEPLPATVEGLRARGLDSAVFDPSGSRPDQGDLLDVMSANAAALERVFAARD